MHVKAPVKGICIQLISLLVSWTAIIFSIVALVGKAPATAEGGALTIVSICVTLIVGVSVVDSLVVQKHGEKLRQLENNMKKIEQLKKDLEIAKGRDDELRLAIYMSWGLALLHEEPLAAFEQFQKMLKLALEDKKYIDEACKAVEFMEQLVPRIEEDIEKNDSYRQILQIRIPGKTHEEIKVLSCYATFKDRIDGIYQKIADLAAEKQ